MSLDPPIRSVIGAIDLLSDPTIGSISVAVVNVALKKANDFISDELEQIVVSVSTRGCAAVVPDRTALMTLLDNIKSQIVDWAAITSGNSILPPVVSIAKEGDVIKVYFKRK